MTGKQEVEAVTSRSRRLIVQFADHALGTTSTSGAMEPGAWREARFVTPLAWGLAKGDCVSLCPGGCSE